MLLGLYNNCSTFIGILHSKFWSFYMHDAVKACENILKCCESILFCLLFLIIEVYGKCTCVLVNHFLLYLCLLRALFPKNLLLFLYLRKYQTGT